MRLKPEVIKDVLLKIEEVVILDEELNFEGIGIEDFCELLPKYSKAEIAYTCLKLDEGNLITFDHTASSGTLAEGYISGITYYGHEFLEQIRNETVWNKIKDLCKKAGCYLCQAISFMAAAGEAILLEAIKGNFIS